MNENNIAFYISSCINVKRSNNIGFGHGSKRSEFSNEERFRQTQFTIANIRLLLEKAILY